MIDKNCEHAQATNLRPFYGTTPHLFCPACKSHQYNGEWYTKSQWDAWVNDSSLHTRLAARNTFDKDVII
jgi:hypothetical protein